MKKTIILGMPNDFYLANFTKQNLIQCGFEIIDISFSTWDFKYKNIFERTHNFIKKTFLNDKGFKAKLKFERNEKKIKDKLNVLNGKADYALLIRPDIYPKELIQLLKTKTNSLIGYQWDGLNRFPIVYNQISLFNRFFVFDTNDFASKNNYSNIHFTTNFYFDIPEFVQQVDKEIKNQVFYIGSYKANRLKILEEISEKLNMRNVKCKIILRSTRKILPHSRSKLIEITNKKISYEENINLVKESSFIIDIPFEKHNGLSFRIFETICFEKKLITNNTEIIHYDFYKKENIFIIGQDDDAQLENFINSSYVALNPSIKEKYSFTNWIKYILDMPPYLPITPPSNC